jgi:hypothetical protein
MPTIGLLSDVNDPKVFAEPNGWTDAVAVTTQYEFVGPNPYVSPARTGVT